MLDFCQFQPGVVHETVSYIKNCVPSRENCYATILDVFGRSVSLHHGFVLIQTIQPPFICSKSTVGNTGTICEICLRRRSGVFLVNFEQISYILLVFPFLSLNKKHHFKYFKGCLPQIPLGLFLNTLSHIKIILWEFGKTFSSHAPLKFAFLSRLYFTFYVRRQIYFVYLKWAYLKKWKVLKYKIFLARENWRPKN